MAEITLIFAMDREGAIGKEGKLPWHLSDDLKHFSTIKKGGVVVMGRKTYDSLPDKFKPLPNRENVILTRDNVLSIRGCRIVYTANDVLLLYKSREIFVIGGAEIFSLFLSHATRMIVTHVDTNVDGDTFFPEIKDNWKPTRQILTHEADNRNQFPFTITEYSRI